MAKPPDCFVNGNGSNGVMIIGEPFGPAGFLFHKVLKRFVKEPRENFTIVNNIFSSYFDTSHLDAVIIKAKPRAIVALGDTAMERVIGLRRIDKRQNYAYWSNTYRCWVVPALAPSFIQHGNHRYQPVLGHAIKKALAIAQDGYQYEQFNTILQPSVLQAGQYANRYLAALAANKDLVLAFDLETNFKSTKDESKLKVGTDPSFEILQISFAFEGNTGIAMEWSAAFLPTIRRMFASPGTKCVWNRNYDVPRLIHNGITINGNIRDTMVAWHALQSDLDKSLNFVTPLVVGNHRFPHWKDQNVEDGGWYYSAMDSIALWRNDTGIMKTLEQEGILPFFTNYVEACRPVLDDMQTAGMLVDKELQAEFSAKMEAKLATIDAKMQAIVPDELKNIHPKKGYKKDPKDTTGMRQIYVPNQEWTICPVCYLKNPTKPHFKTYKSKKCAHKNTKCSGAEPQRMKGNERRWAKILPFKPSTQQLVGYAHHHGYKVKQNWKTQKDTMDKEALAKLIKRHPKDPLFPLLAEYKDAQDLLGKYGPDGMFIGPDGRVHTTFTDNPSTFRFSSYGPNMQNIPRGNADENDPANYIRRLFVAAPGHILGARDYTGIEAVVVGYLAHDRDYIRLAKRGVHDYFNAHLAYHRGIIKATDIPDLAWSDDDLTGALKALKTRLSDTRPVSKSAVHGSNYLETPYMMNHVAPDLWGGVRKAAEVQDLYFEVFPSIKIWQHMTCDMAEKQGYLVNPFGLPHRFLQVYDYEKDEDNNWVKKLGPDAKRAAAFGPQSIAACVMRKAIRDAGQSHIREYLRLTIHDELMLECLRQLLEAVDAVLKEIMERPVEELPLDPEWGMGEYLNFDTEEKSGERWGDME